MKRILLILIATTISLTTLAEESYKGEHTVGILAGYNTRTESIIAGAYFQYRFSKYFRIAPDFQYAFSNNGLSAYKINGNIHIPIALGDKTNIFPLTGVSYQSLKAGAASDDYLGLNLGAGVEFMLTKSLKLLFQGKYTFLKENSNSGTSVAIGYLF